MKRQRKVVGIAVLLTTLTSIGIVRGAQKPSRPVSAYGDMVFINAAVTADGKKDVRGVRREQFQVYEDGVEQKLAYFSEQGPWNVEMVVGIEVLKMQRSDRDAIAIREALAEFKDAFGKDTSRKNDLINIDELPFGSNGLYDGITKAITKVSQVANPRKAVLVIADGFDSVGGDPSAQLIEFARVYNVPVFSVFLRNAAVDGVINSQDDPESKFRQLANITGGQYLITEPIVRDSPGASTLGITLKRLATELKTQYVLGFLSTNDAKDNKYRKVKVTARPLADGTKLNVAAKTEYFVPKP